MAPLMALSARKQLSLSLQSAVWLWATVNVFSILFILPIPLVTALNPISVYAMAYATINEDKLIIQGGVEYQAPTLAPTVNQLMILDLTLPTWNVNNPPWSYIPMGVPLPANLTTAFHSMSVSPDRNTFMIWDPNSPGSLTSFDMFKEAWTHLAVPAAFQISEKELKAATNPLTGKVYIPLGDRKMNMLVWDPANPSSGAGAAAVGPTPSGAAPDGTSPSGAGTVSSELMPDAVKEGMVGYTWTWCPSRKTFILFGGKPGSDPTAPYLHEFQPKGSKWTAMNTTGTVPPRMTGSCMEPAYKGTKMILFGGKGAEQVGTGSIYILDLPTMVWSQGPNLDALQNRSHMACGVSGDSFVVVGGIRRTDPNTIFKVDATPLVYNINSNMWVPRFDRQSHYIEPSPTSTKPTKPVQSTETSLNASPSSSGLSGVAIAFIVVAVVVVIGVFVLFLVKNKHSPLRRVKRDGRAGGTSEIDPTPRLSNGSQRALPGSVPRSGNTTLGPGNSKTALEPHGYKAKETPIYESAQSNNPQYKGSYSDEATVSSTDGQREGSGTGRGGIVITR